MRKGFHMKMKWLFVALVALTANAVFAEVDFSKVLAAVRAVQADSLHTNGMDVVMETAKETAGNGEVISRCMALYAARLAMTGNAQRFQNTLSAVESRFPGSAAHQQLSSVNLLNPVASSSDRLVVNRQLAATVFGTIAKGLETLLSDTTACDEALAKAPGMKLDERIKFLEEVVKQNKTAIRLNDAVALLKESRQERDRLAREERQMHNQRVNALQNVLPLQLRIQKIKQYIKEYPNSPFMAEAQMYLESAEALYAQERESARRKSMLIKTVVGAVAIMALFWLISFIKVNLGSRKVVQPYKPMIAPAEDDTPFDPYAGDEAIDQLKRDSVKD